jgi:hypothetical protein
MKPALFLAILVAAIPQERKHLEGTDDLEFPVELVKSLFQLFRISKPQDVIVAGHKKVRLCSKCKVNILGILGITIEWKDTWNIGLIS